MKRNYLLDACRKGCVHAKTHPRPALLGMWSLASAVKRWTSLKRGKMNYCWAMMERAGLEPTSLSPDVSRFFFFFKMLTGTPTDRA